MNVAVSTDDIKLWLSNECHFVYINDIKLWLSNECHCVYKWY